MNLLKHIFILTALLIVNISCGQAEKLTVIVDRIAKINEVQQEHVGIAGTESENYKNFKQLKEIATTDQLVQLTDNKKKKYSSLQIKYEN